MDNTSPWRQEPPHPATHNLPARLPARPDVREAIIAELRRVTAETTLTVVEYPDINGAAVRGRTVEAYVYQCSGGFLQIDLWHHNASDPYRILRTQDPATAITLAVTQALDPDQRRSWHAHHDSQDQAAEYTPTDCPIPADERRPE
jgi:hypothetical protein